MNLSQRIVAPSLRDKKIFCFGFGYTASFLSAKLSACGWQIFGTTTSPAKKEFLQKNGIQAWLFDDHHDIPDPFQTFHDITHILLSVPPNAEGDPVFETYASDLIAMKNLEWVGYLSTTAVYGNQDGHWVDETTQATPSSRRGSLRLRAEQQWQSLHLTDSLPLHIFRLSGIYGPGRSAIDAVRSGTARRIDKPGHAFNRIHIDDIVQTLIASMNQPKPGNIYNLADDTPSPSHEVIQFACNLIGISPPPLIPFEQAELAPIVRSFYKDNKRVHNDKIKNELGVTLLHPDYRSGLQACLEVEKETAELLQFSADDATGG
ncbi:MAG: SDR family oxidoreductase [Proteobacteria bacterium]|nr:SDR family oxidoreductase [Pseudomonadota bacterium]